MMRTRNMSAMMLLGFAASLGCAVAQHHAKSMAGMSARDHKFAMEAAQGGMAEVQLGKLATERGHAQAIKDFGQRMVTDHSKANDELKTLASQKGMTLPSSIGPKHEAVAKRLSKLSGAAFDKAYAQAMVKDHVEDVAEFRKQAKSGKDPDLKSWAGKTVPTLQMHLTMIRGIAKKVTASR